MITELILYIQTNLSNEDQIILLVATILITLALYKLDKIMDKKEKAK